MSERGYIVPIGGAEEKLRDPVILRRFARICGGREARIVVIPTASELKETGRNYRRLFRDLDARSVKILEFRNRRDCERQDWLETLAQADGVFLTGGNQLRLSTTIVGTPVADTLRRRNREGQHIAGTSAGAAFISSHMIAFGDNGQTPRSDMVTLAQGLALTRRVIVDQHFRQRDRLGRLITAISYNPEHVGIGLDEDTAAFIGPDNVLTVVGSGGITVVDPTRLEYSSMDSSGPSGPISVIGLRLHVLIDCGTFNLDTREASAGVPIPERR